MGRHLNIESDRAFEIATSLADRQGKSVTEIVEAALAAYAEATERPEDRLARWKALLAEDWKNRNESGFEIEDLYDSETGLPA